MSSLHPESDCRLLPLDGWHKAHGARMVPFAGYSMPIQYEGIVAEHEWTRTHAGLFDVSHMGQITISGLDAAEALEALLPASITSLKPGRIRYSLLLAENGGILDDLMVTNAGDGDYYVVVNGATKADDIAHMQALLPEGVALTHHEDLALLAIQGPEAAEVMDLILPGLSSEIAFMQSTARDWKGATLRIGRSGYTGEDGYEISVPATMVEAFADALLQDERAKPIGLGARDSLRLEAGLPLYGHDLDPETDPVSADLGFALSKVRREQGGFPGADKIAALLEQGASTKRVGLVFDGRLPAREGAQVFDGETLVGKVTSGGFAPTLGQPIAMAYVDAACAALGQKLTVEVRNKRLDATVSPMPFVPHRYFRAGEKK